MIARTFVLLYLAILLAGCRHSPTAPAASAPPTVEAPQLPRDTGDGPTRTVELTNLHVRLIDEPARAWVPGPALEFASEIDLHGWRMDQFRGAHPQPEPEGWIFAIYLDVDHDGLWDFIGEHYVGTIGPMLYVSDAEGNQAAFHEADITIAISDEPGSKDRGGMHFSIPLADLGLSAKQPIRWMLYTSDGYGFPYELHRGTTGAEVAGR